MPTLIGAPTRVEAAGNKPKLIDEYVGRVNTRSETVSIAHMRSREAGRNPDRCRSSMNLRWFCAECYELKIGLARLTSVPDRQ
jgi:hypothetical protein